MSSTFDDQDREHDHRNRDVHDVNRYEDQDRDQPNRFADDRAELDERYRKERSRSKSSSGCQTIAIGCGCALVVMLVIAAGVGIWVAKNWKRFAAEVSKNAAQEAINRSKLPKDQKERVLKRINQLADDFESGKLSTQQAGKVLEQITNSPLLPVALVMAADQNYVQPSGLSDEEKKAAQLTLQRLGRGIFEKKIKEEDIQEVLKLMSETGPGGNDKIKEHLTDDELKAVLEKAKEKADAANVSDEPFEIDVADELEKAIDRALKDAPPAD